MIAQVNSHFPLHLLISFSMIQEILSRISNGASGLVTEATSEKEWRIWALDYGLVANRVLLTEYRKYAEALNVMNFFEFLKMRFKVVDHSRRKVLKCLLFSFKPSCWYRSRSYLLKTGTIITTNDKHFEKVGKEGLIKVWNIKKVIEELLEMNDI